MDTLLKHHPITATRDGQDVVLSQPVGETCVEIRISASQALEIAALLNKVAAKRRAPVQDGSCEHFEDFWRLYPSARRVDRAGMMAKWKARGLDSQWPAIQRHLTAMKSSKDWTKDGGRFIPMISTYVNQSRWEQEVQQAGPVVDV